MSKRNIVALFAFALVLGFSSFAIAEDGVAVAKASVSWTFFGLAIATGFALGIAALGTGLAMGNAINGAMQGVSRNPEAGGRIFTMLIMGLAFIESIIIYALLIGFMFWMKIPDYEPLMEAIVKSIGA